MIRTLAPAPAAARRLRNRLYGDPAGLFLATSDQRVVTARRHPTSYRRALKMMAHHGAEQVAVLVQGQMSKANELESAGISAIVKKPKEAARAGAEERAGAVL